MTLNPRLRLQPPSPAWVGGIASAVLLLLAGASASAAPRPNVLIIITDDQGYGDLGFHGNPVLRTPHLDALARQSARCQFFHVSPVCAPTRASLLTGRYNYRTGVVDTFIGRALMHPDELTLAEILSRAGYRTGLFGKWHLGDNFPLRPQDQGFQETLVHKGGGIGQPSDPPGGDHYFDPTLYRNGQPVKTRGYCTDVFTDAALAFLETNRARPFFVWLAFNAPHTPLEAPANHLAYYQTQDLSPAAFPTNGQPLPRNVDTDTTAKVYAMVSNIDDNVGRLLTRLDALNLAANTIVLFLTDNGPQQPRFNAGLRDRKGSVHDGGIRVPFFLRWPGRLEAGRVVDRVAAHIDVAPTLLEACGVRPPARARFDGRSLWPLLTGQSVSWPDRTLYFQWHRGDVPTLGRACAARSQRWKLVQPLGANQNAPADAPFLLFDMLSDPFELRDVAADHPDIVAQMKRGYEAWFRDVSATRGFDPPRIHLGAPEENPVVLTRQDWRGPRAGWATNSLGHWEVHVAHSGAYDITLRFPPRKRAATARVALRGVNLERELSAGATDCTFRRVRLTQGPGRLEAWLAGGPDTVGVHYVELLRLREAK
jgi:arylsulfatase A-like enzyme